LKDTGRKNEGKNQESRSKQSRCRRLAKGWHNRKQCVKQQKERCKKPSPRRDTRGKQHNNRSAGQDNGQGPRGIERIFRTDREKAQDKKEAQRGGRLYSKSVSSNRKTGLNQRKIWVIPRCDRLEEKKEYQRQRTVLIARRGIWIGGNKEKWGLAQYNAHEPECNAITLEHTAVQLEKQTPQRTR